MLPGFARELRAGTIWIALLIGVALFTPRADGQVILDDYSLNDESNYNYLPRLNNPPDGWNVSSGELRPSITGNATGAWLWNHGEKLAEVGDSVSINLSLPGAANNGFWTGIGLLLSPRVDSASSLVGFWEITLSTSGGTYEFGITTATSVHRDSGPFPSSGTLTIEMIDQTPRGGSQYEVSYPGMTAPIVISASHSLYFGPVAYNTATTAAAFDNLTLTAVPKPSMYLAVFGVIALAMVCVQRRRKSGI